MENTHEKSFQNFLQETSHVQTSIYRTMSTRSYCLTFILMQQIVADFEQKIFNILELYQISSFSQKSTIAFPFIDQFKGPHCQYIKGSRIRTLVLRQMDI